MYPLTELGTSQITLSSGMMLARKIMHRWLPMILTFALTKLVNSLPGTVPVYQCQSDAGKYTQNETYAQNINLVLSDLISNSSSTRFHNSTAGQGLDRVYALFYCRGDIGSDDCYDCVQGTVLWAREWCPSYKEAIVWYEQCTLRYANRVIFSKEEEDPWGIAYNPVNVTDPNSLSQAVFATMGRLFSDAAYNATLNGFSTGIASYASRNVYCIVQCSPDILGSPCHNCLAEALTRVRSGGPKAASILLPSCRIMYDFDPLFSITNSPPPQGKNPRHYLILILITLYFHLV